MKTRIALAAALLLASTSASSQDGQLRYVIDDSASEVEARVAFAGLSHKTARFPDMSGRFTLSLADPEEVDMAVTVDARTLTTGDSQTARLRGRQFFDVAHHPTVTFTGDQIHFTGERSATVTGHVTAKGITRPSTINVTFSRPIAQSGSDQAVTIVGTTSFDRRQFNMTAFPLIIGNQVNITIRARLVPA